RLDAFFCLWTCKEAWVKAAGVGLSFPLAQVEVLLDAGESATLLSQDGRPGPAAAWSVRTLAPAGGYAAAVVAEGGGVQVRDWEAGGSEGHEGLRNYHIPETIFKGVRATRG